MVNLFYIQRENYSVRLRNNLGLTMRTQRKMASIQCLVSVQMWIPRR